MLQKSINKLVTIIPLRRVPKQFEFLTYQIPSGMSLALGEVVRVPFGKSAINGLVWGYTNETPRYPLKEVSEKTGFALPDESLSLMQFMIKKYECTAAAVLDLFLNADLLSKVNKKSIQETTPHDKKTLSENNIYIEKNQVGRAQLLMLLAQKNPGTTLICVPEQFTLKQLEAPLREKIPELTTLHGEMTPKERAAVFEKAYNQESSCFLTTRLGLFLPFKGLSHIVVIDEESEAHEEIHKPTYHTSDIATELSKLYGASLSYISPTPRLETWHAFTTQHETSKAPSAQKSQHIFYLTNTPPENTEVEIISMSDERRRGVSGPFAEAALEQMARALAQNKQVLIFLNRRGKAGMILCKECHQSLVCPRCKNPLSLHGVDNLSCHRCGYMGQLPNYCPNCQSVRLQPIMVGTQAIETLLNKIFDRATVVRLDSDTLKGRKKIRAALSPEVLQKADIIIATRMIDKPLSLPRLTLSIAVMPDLLLNLPTFRAHEKALQTLNRLKINTHGRLILQTYFPECSVYTTLQSGQLETFYAQELQARKILKLPPFTP